MSSCSNFLYVQQQKVNCRELASTYVDTPDPLQECPPCGQRLVVSWDASGYEGDDKLFIRGKVIFCDLTEKIFSKEICKGSSTTEFYFPLDPNNKNPILSYKLDIVSEEGEVINSWTHKLWVKPLLISEE